MSGSYGVSGVAKLSAAVSAYAGYSSASSSKSINVTYQILVAGGVETISLDSLSPALLMAALASGPRHKLGKVLDSYRDLMVTLGGDNFITVISDPMNAKYNRVSKAYRKWALAAQGFRHRRWWWACSGAGLAAAL
jgi:hypothetical protein